MTDTPDARDQLIVALDCPAAEALSLAGSLQGTVRWLKVGMTLFYREGPAIVEQLRDRGFDIFLDLKLHDIPHQVAGAARSVAGLGAKMLTVHASGGTEMLERAVEGARAGASDAGIEPPSVLAITVLTSMDDDMLRRVSFSRDAAQLVPHLTRLALDSGVDGLVCSPLETSVVRSIAGQQSLVVTPGVRPTWSDAGDQKRVTTPFEAIQRGASHLVVGRPITAATDPAEAAARVIAEMEGRNR